MAAAPRRMSSRGAFDLRASLVAVLVFVVPGDGEDRNPRDRRRRPQISWCEHRAAWERHDDALGLAGAEADRAEVAVDLDHHVLDRRLAGGEERGMHD